MKLRKYIKLIHRDLGYIAAALTIIYSVSGIAVNHVDEWNPNYIITDDTLSFHPPDTVTTGEMMSAYVLGELKINEEPNEIFRSGENTIEIFLENRTISADVEKGIAKMETVESRPVIRETNFLHLNAPKQVWTYIADAFAVVLILLAVTGLFMIKGKNGITGRGKWLTLAGILVPVIFLFIYYY